MHDPWFEVVESVLRPARSRLEPCVREGAIHRAARTLATAERARALANCESRIEAARAAVLTADDGVIPSLMTNLEREWRALSRSDSDVGLMELWARIAPSSWLDRKLWRDSAPAARLDTAIALAADVEGVEAAESAVGSLRAALAAWGTPLGPRIRFCPFDRDANGVTELLAKPHQAALEILTERHEPSALFERARQLEHSVHEAARARFPERPLLAQTLAHAALVDYLLHAAALALPNPVQSLRALWQTGYALAAVDASGVTLEIPEL